VVCVVSTYFLIELILLYKEPNAKTPFKKNKANQNWNKKAAVATATQFFFLPVATITQSAGLLILVRSTVGNKSMLSARDFPTVIGLLPGCLQQLSFHLFVLVVGTLPCN
jgi:hypothetical protein